MSVKEGGGKGTFVRYEIFFLRGKPFLEFSEITFALADKGFNPPPP